MLFLVTFNRCQHELHWVLDNSLLEKYMIPKNEKWEKWMRMNNAMCFNNTTEHSTYDVLLLIFEVVKPIISACPADLQLFFKCEAET